MDIASIAGIVLAFAAILGGQALEGGHAGSLMQPTAAIIVLGGTLGAVLVSFPKQDFMRGMKLAKEAFTDKASNVEGVVKELIELATLARRDGVLALEGKLATVQDPFLRRCLALLVDGVDASVARDTLETEIHHEFDAGSVGAKVFESAGAFAPTIGILGAVLGLIHVMENLDDPTKLGPGIAVAFVATIYGVGFANIFFLPMAAKIKRKLTLEKERKTAIAEGVLSIQAGLNPRVLEEKLKAYTGHHPEPHAP